MNARRSLVAIILGSLAACTELPSVDPDHVIVLSSCPAGDGFFCGKEADGQSLITVEACVDPSVPRPLADVQLSLTLSAGQWQGQDATTRTVSESVKVDSCFRPTFVTSPQSTSVQIEAELQGFRPPPLRIDLQPATLTGVELTTAALPVHAGQQNQLQFRVRTTHSGTPTLGSSLVLSVIAAPATAQASVWPDHVVLDSTGTGSAQLFVTPDATEATVHVEAYPPSPSANTDPYKRDFPLPVAPP